MFTWWFPIPMHQYALYISVLLLVRPSPMRKHKITVQSLVYTQCNSVYKFARYSGKLPKTGTTLVLYVAKATNMLQHNYSQEELNTYIHTYYYDHRTYVRIYSQNVEHWNVNSTDCNYSILHWPFAVTGTSYNIIMKYYTVHYILSSYYNYYNMYITYQGGCEVFQKFMHTLVSGTKWRCGPAANEYTARDALRQMIFIWACPEECE